MVKHLPKQLKPLALMPKLIRFESEHVSLFTCASDELSKSYYPITSLVCIKCRLLERFLRISKVAFNYYAA